MLAISTRSLKKHNFHAPRDGDGTAVTTFFMFVVKNMVLVYVFMQPPRCSASRVRGSDDPLKNMNMQEECE